MSTDTNTNHAGDDIKHMLSEVIAHITDADRRSTASLRQMQERLETLGHEARSVREGVPAGYLPGFERIEDGMSLLAARIAESYSAREPMAAHAAAGPVTSFATVTANQSSPTAMPAATEPTAAEFAPVTEQAYIPATFIAASVSDAEPVSTVHTNAARFDLEQPNPLSSTSPGLLRARSTVYAPGVDTFDVIETLPDTSPDTSNESWSPDTAAALVNVYAGDEALPFHAAALAEIPVAPILAPVLPPVVETHEPVAVDKLWLDGRLSEIATRVERSLAESRSGKALASMEHRLDEFEQRMIAVLNGVATKHDVENLASLETQIRELRAQFELTHSELMRIDDLERQLSHIAQQTSDENVGAMMTRFVPASSGGTDADFHSVAIAAAEAAASRVSTAGNGRSSRVEDVHTLLAEFIQERRQGEEQTANTLDTLQQAMLRILDRVDAIDVNPATAAYHVSNPYEAQHVAAQHVAADHAEPDAPRVAYSAPLAAPVVEPEIAAAPQQPMPAGDYLAQQRAKMQASVQRAAAAQREKQKTQHDEAAAKTAIARPAKADPAGGSRRLMVSSLALAVVAGGLSAFAVMSSGSRDTVNIADIPTPQAVTGQAAGMASSLAAATNTATANLTAATQTAGTEPQTSTGDFADAVVTEPATAKSAYARTQSTTPGPFSGILLQGSGDAEPASPAAPTPGSEQNGVKATQVAAQMTDLEQMTSAGPSTQSRGALDLPPATVGPLSLRIAAAQGDASAEFEVASRLAEGKGTDQNLKEAVRWYQRSATQGFAQAQYRLGTFYERGLGMKADPARARVWYQRAADQGNVKAMHNLAVLAAGRSAESPDYTTAARWFTQAASYGLADSQFNLAVLTESGLGVEKDMVQAAMWFNIAARSGDKEATRRRDLMKSKMDTKDLAAAEHLVKSWQPIVPEKMANDPRAAGEAWKTRQAASPETR